MTEMFYEKAAKRLSATDEGQAEIARVVHEEWVAQFPKLPMEELKAIRSDMFDMATRITKLMPVDFKWGGEE